MGTVAYDIFVLLLVLRQVKAIDKGQPQATPCKGIDEDCKETEVFEDLAVLHEQTGAVAANVRRQGYCHRDSGLHSTYKLLLETDGFCSSWHYSHLEGR